MSISGPSRSPASLDYPEVSAGSIIAGSAARFGDRTAFAHGDEQLTYAEVYRAACQFANALLRNGVEPGDRVAVHLANCLAYPVAYYGILLAGATFTPANPLLPPADLAAQLADSGAVAAVTSGAGLPVLAAVQDRTRVGLVVVVGPTTGQPGQREFTEFYAAEPETRPEVDLDVYTHLAHLAYTGGTTGGSKGVRLTHRNVCVNSLQFACWSSGSVPALDERGDLVLDRSHAGDDEWPTRLGEGVLIGLAPWFHAMGTIGTLNVPVLQGTTLVLQNRFNPADYLAEAERRQVTSLGGAPAMFAALLACPDFPARDLSSVRSITSGAAPMPHEMIRALRHRFPDAAINEGYGLTEVTMGAAQGPFGPAAVRKPGTVGLPVFDTEIKIVSAESGDPVPRGEPGEVCIRGPQVMAGYHERPAETAATLVDGWLHTGDIGVLDEDGYLSIVDRKKDLLLYKGYNVYPRELEELLLAQPGVAGAAVVGRPSPEVGELPVAFVVRGPGADSITEQQLIDSVNAKVVPYKRLRELRFVERIPVSAAGKILKRELRALLT